MLHIDELNPLIRKENSRDYPCKTCIHPAYLIVISLLVGAMLILFAICPVSGFVFQKFRFHRSNGQIPITCWDVPYGEDCLVSGLIGHIFFTFPGFALLLIVAAAVGSLFEGRCPPYL